jgi:preprotein translocase subunit SecB
MFKLINVIVNTEEMRIKNNHLPQGDFDLNPQVARDVGVEDENKNQYYTTLKLNITMTEDNPTPVDLLVVLKAIFTIEKNPGCERKHIERFLRQQGVHILYPYVRSSISALTGAASLPPITLPVVNAFALFKEDKEWIKNHFNG